MTHLAPGGQLLVPPLASQRVTADLEPIDDLGSLSQRLAARREDQLELEMAWVAAAEGQAARKTHGVRIDDRATWDRAMWDRYLAAASSLEADFKPKITRNIEEIEILEKLLTLPSGRLSAAA